MRYLRLLGLQLRLSLLKGMQYRWDFVTDGAVSIAWTSLGLVPLWVAFHARRSIGGWSFAESLLVVGWFTLLKGVLDGAVNPSLLSVVDHIRKGTLDFVLLKPADAQFLVSTSRFELWKGLDVLGGLAIFAWSFMLRGESPTLPRALASLGLGLCAIALLYSIWIVVIAAAFWVVRLDNLAYLLSSLFDFARWPVTVMKGAFRIFFTFVLPLGVMTTYPAQALLGRLDLTTAAATLVGTVVFAFVARRIFSHAIGHYTSASS